MDAIKKELKNISSDLFSISKSVEFLQMYLDQMDNCSFKEIQENDRIGQRSGNYL